MAAVQSGVGREEAHEAIKEHAVGVALAMREQGQPHNDLMERLLGDGRLRLSPPAMAGLLEEPLNFVGLAQEQTRRFVETVGQLVERYPDSPAYEPAAIL